jgi:hypothetical protein
MMRWGRYPGQLTLLSQGDIPRVEEDELWIHAIKLKAPSIMTAFYKLGIDLLEVCRVLIYPLKEIGHESKPEAGKVQFTEEEVIDL